MAWLGMFWGIFGVLGYAEDGGVDWSEVSVEVLEERYAEVEEELGGLASMVLRTGLGSVGYRSHRHDDTQVNEWVQIDLDGVREFDEVVIVPSVWRSGTSEYQADGFPVKFRVVAGGGEDGAVEVLAEFDREDGILPRIAPVIVPCEGTVARWVRLEIEELTPVVWGGYPILQLAEVLVFSGNENIALRGTVTCSGKEVLVPRNQVDLIVDGLVPYLMDAAEGAGSLAFVSKPGIGELPELVIDLGERRSINEIHLHRVDLSDSVPQSTRSNFGVPRWLRVEGGNEADWSDAVELTEFRIASDYVIGPVMMRRFSERACRYVRLIAEEPYIRPAGESHSGRSQIGFAEIEIFERGENVAKGGTVSVAFHSEGRERSLGALTDGENFYGEILPFRRWLEELERRHVLEREIPMLRAELDERYLRQRVNLRRMGWLVGVLSIGILVSVLFGRLMRLRKVAEVRERMAADLHDELGANLHTIGLLSDLAEEDKDDPAQLAEYHRRIRSETERSGLAVRRCVGLLGVDGEYNGLVEDMRRSGRRIMGRMEHKFSVSGEEFLAGLAPQTAYDLFLFYKECLVNISRHSGATALETQLSADEQAVRLVVWDNGQGMSERRLDVPGSLERRARLLKAKVDAGISEAGGVQIELVLPKRRSNARRIKE